MSSANLVQFKYTPERLDGIATRVFLLCSATMVELRKRKAPAPPPVVKKSKSTPPKPDNANSTSQTDAPKVPQVDDVLDLENFGGEIETNDGSKTSLKKLVESSTSGVVLFTYPKASTPGCMYPPPVDSTGVQRSSYTSP